MKLERTSESPRSTFSPLREGRKIGGDQPWAAEIGLVVSGRQKPAIGEGSGWIGYQTGGVALLDGGPTLIFTQKLLVPLAPVPNNTPALLRSFQFPW